MQGLLVGAAVTLWTVVFERTFGVLASAPQPRNIAEWVILIGGCIIAFGTLHTKVVMPCVRGIRRFQVGVDLLYGLAPLYARVAQLEALVRAERERLEEDFRPPVDTGSSS